MPISFASSPLSLLVAWFCVALFGFFVRFASSLFGGCASIASSGALAFFLFCVPGAATVPVFVATSVELAAWAVWLSYLLRELRLFHFFFTLRERATHVSEIG